MLPGGKVSLDIRILVYCKITALVIQGIWAKRKRSAFFVVFKFLCMET